MLTDSHCHLDRLDLKPYEGQFVRFMEDAKSRGVGQFLCVAIDMERYPAMKALVQDYPEIAVSVGVHPNEHEGREPSVKELVELAQDPKVVAIGETGLDYFRSEADSTWQKDRFRRHIQAARLAGKPLIIHTREARADTLAILEQENAAEVGGVFHCFTEDWETAQRALDLNFHISFSGIVTFRNARHIQEAARRIPEDRFLIETDSPYLAPIPHRGKPNYPHFVRYVAECITELRGTTYDRIVETSTRNYRELFAVAG